MTIQVRQTGDGDPFELDVEVREGGGQTRHRVTVRRDTLARLAPGRGAEELVRAAFTFLLEREPKESILSRFDVTVIGRYFPEFEREIGAIWGSEAFGERVSRVRVSRCEVWPNNSIHRRAATRHARGSWPRRGLLPRAVLLHWRPRRRAALSRGEANDRDRRWPFRAPSCRKNRAISSIPLILPLPA